METGVGDSNEPVTIDHERSWQLTNAADGTVGPVATQHRAGQLQSRNRTVDLLDGAVHQPVGGVRGPVGIGQDRKWQIQLLPEPTRVPRRTLTNGGDADAFGREGGGAIAQGRDLLPAERAAVLAQEDQHQGARRIDPEIGEVSAAGTGVVEEDIPGGVTGNWCHTT